jgi:hypothetical protein
MRVAASTVVSLGLAVTLVAAQRPFAKAVFEYGEVRSFEGRLTADPYPLLEVTRPGVGAEQVSRYLLVAPFKFGLGATGRSFDGQRVRLSGTLVHRDGRTLIEVEDGSIATVDSVPSNAAPQGDGAESLGVQTLRGEIVDSKCFLGVMKPGNLKPHRACAVRCISGGIPPVFLVTDAAGRATCHLLTGADGRAVNREVLDRVAEPLEITGEVLRLGDLLLLRSDPATYRRVE